MNTENLSLQQQFAQLQQEHQQQQSHFETLSDQHQKLKNRQILEQSATYTVDTIVKGLADMQIQVGATVKTLGEQLSREAEKLSDLSLALQVAETELSELRRVRVAADMVFLKKQEHQEAMQLLSETYEEHHEKLEKTRTEAQRAWEKEQAEYERKEAERQEAERKEREQEEADFTYELERERKQAADEQQEDDRNFEKELKEQEETLKKDWKAREEVLSKQQEKYETSKAKVEAFPAELEEATKKAREEGIRSATQDAKVKAELIEKDWEATKQSYDLQIEALQSTFESQEAQIAELQAQLLKISEQTQQLAARAFKGSEA